jgi:hypothetical protein
VRDRPNLAERILGRIGFALSIPTMAPMAALTAALARVQRSGLATRALLAPLLGVAIFIAFIVTTIVFAPYYLLLRLGSAIGAVDLSAPHSISVGEIVREGNFESFAIDMSLPYDDRAEAIATLTRLIAAITEGDVHYFRETFGPFTTSAAQIPQRIASFVESVDYGANARHCWFVKGTLPEDIAFDLGVLHEGWNAEIVDSMLDEARTYCHVELMADQGIYSAQIVVCARGDEARRCYNRVRESVGVRGPRGAGRSTDPSF